MRLTVTHNKSVDEIKKRVDSGFNDIFQGLPIPALQITDTERVWNGSTMTYSFTAVAGFITVPIKGTVLVEEKLVTIDVDLPAFVSNFIPEAKMKEAVEAQVKGLLA